MGSSSPTTELELPMPVPTHAASCSTKTWHTECPECHKPVFFSCTCGSKVFFDALGDPWPHHSDTCLFAKVRELRDSDGPPLHEVKDLVETEARRRQVSVPPAVAALFRASGYRETGVPTMLRLTPGVEERDFIGVITGFNPKVNFFKRFQITDNPMGRGLLGSLAKEEHFELFVKGAVNRKTGFCPQIEGFVSKKLFDAGRVGRAVQVVLRIAPRTLGAHRLWIVVALSQEEWRPEWRA